MSKIEKLPKWAQEHIESLQRQRDIAVHELNAWRDEQTKSPVYIRELISTGEERGPSFKTRYIQTRKVEFDWLGVGLTVLLRDEGIDLQWEDSERHVREVAMIPRSFQQVYLVAKEKMR